MEIELFYTYCYFDSWEQFAEINDNADEPLTREPKQLYGDHSDNLLAMVEKKSKEEDALCSYGNLFFWTLSTNLIMKKELMLEKYFGAYDTAFGGCNLMEHILGPEQAWYFVCGYDSYADFAKKVKVIGDIHESELADVKLDVLEHSDDLMVRVE